MFIMGVVMILVGFFMIFKAEMFWKITESWKSHSSIEPSSLYKWSTRLGGLIVLGIGVVAVAITFMD